MDITKIELVLENCEVVSVDAKYIGKIIARNIFPAIENDGYDDIKRSFYCYSFGIELHKDLDKYGVVQSYTPEGLPGVFRRLRNYNDITQVIVHYNDDINETYFVDYGGDEENKNQKSYISTAGHLYIKISDMYSLGDMFGDDILDNPDYEWPWVRD